MPQSERESLRNDMFIRYNFRFGANGHRCVDLTLAGRTFDLRPLRPAPETPPTWTRLGAHRCANCALVASHHQCCPVALNLVPVVDLFHDASSVTVVDIEVETPNRTVVRQVPLQEALSSLIGVIMATSGCPILDKLRPMVYTHLPLATPMETHFRAVGMYYMAQHLIARRGGRPDWDVAGLAALYHEIRVVNACFSERLRAVVSRDASVNAIVRLDCLAVVSTEIIDDGCFDDFEPLFAAYLGPSPG
ncbi:MAG: hypothetical protein HYV63_15335 [Candidatus Schekmanbacteria bacterium]|nr:hypothetical protein [Candidatus Schekmanbacteria bacterium]